MLSQTRLIPITIYETQWHAALFTLPHSNMTQRLVPYAHVVSPGADNVRSGMMNQNDVPSNANEWTFFVQHLYNHTPIATLSLIHIGFQMPCNQISFACDVVVNLASRPPQFLGSASSAPEGLSSQTGANLVRD